MLTRRQFIALTSTITPITFSNMINVDDGDSGKAHALSMYVGTQKSCSPKMLQFYKRCGVNNICGDPDAWTLDGLLRLKDRCHANDITLDMVPIGMPRSVALLGDKDHRNKQIDQTCEQIQMASKAGIPAIKYNMTVLDVLRTGSSPGRGGSRYSTWQYDKARSNESLTRAGLFPADLFWECITSFLDRVIPVATEHKVKMACHPHDPGVPSEGYRGVQRVLGTVEGLKKFIDISPSPYHGLNFCIGTISSNLENPSTEIFDVIRYFGRRGKIFNIHLRNIQGRRNSFQEVHPDEGDIDMYKVIETLKQVGYCGMIMPDHVPSHTDDPDQLQALAFAFGYIKALIQAAYTKK